MSGRQHIIIAAVVIVVLIGALVWSFRPGASTSTSPQSPLATSKPGRLLDTSTTRPATAIDVRLAFEGNAEAKARLEFKPPLRPPPGLPKAGTLAPLSHGLSRVDLHDFPDGSHIFYVRADGFAPIWVRAQVESGEITEGDYDITLYRPRYVTMRWAFNTKGGKELEGPGVDSGRAAVTHWGQLPHFGQDWQIWQGSDSSSKFGDTPRLELHRISQNFGFAPAPEGAKFDDLKVAAPDTEYVPESLVATPGLLLYCRISGNRGKPPDSGYGKIYVESVSTTRPTGVRIVEGR